MISKQPRKQRKFQATAPLHIKQKFMGASLVKALRSKDNGRSKQVRSGDTIKVVRGQFKGVTGKVDRVDLKRSKLFINEAHVVKKDGSKVFIPIHPSNVIIQEMVKEKRR